MRRQNRLRPAGETLAEVLKNMGLDRKTREHQAAVFWGEIVGEQISKSTRVEKVRDGVLYVDCKNSVWANELLLHKEEILKRIGDRVGGNVIRDVRFSGRGWSKALEKEEEAQAEKEVPDTPLAPSEVKEVEKIVSSVEDSELAEVIRRALSAAKRHTRVKKVGG